MIAALVFLMGVTIRHFFNSMHARAGRPWWTWGVSAALFAAIVWLSMAPLSYDSYEESEARDLTPAEQVFASAEGFETVMEVVPGRCSMCHAREPFYDGIVHPPKGVLLETEADVARMATGIYLHAGRSRAMPPANVSWMEPEERAAIVAWYEGARSR